EPIVRRVHGSTRHVGKVAGRGGADNLRRRAEALRSELQRAVEEERYEDAARLRDQLRELQRQLAEGREAR
ncbi:MAG TPA: UvrB/UvrC motif-containing protein, partial [Bacillota bacterium]